MRPKIDNIIENRSILDKSAKPKSLVLARILLFCAVRIKFTYFPTAPFCFLVALFYLGGEQWNLRRRKRARRNYL